MGLEASMMIVIDLLGHSEDGLVTEICTKEDKEKEDKKKHEEVKDLPVPLPLQIIPVTEAL
jgi:hypothetical protein